MSLLKHSRPYRPQFNRIIPRNLSIFLQLLGALERERLRERYRKEREIEKRERERRERESESERE